MSDFPGLLETILASIFQFFLKLRKPVKTQQVSNGSSAWEGFSISKTLIFRYMFHHFFKFFGEKGGPHRSENSFFLGARFAWGGSGRWRAVATRTPERMKILQISIIYGEHLSRISHARSPQGAGRIEPAERGGTARPFDVLRGEPTALS